MVLSALEIFVICFLTSCARALKDGFNFQNRFVNYTQEIKFDILMLDRLLTSTLLGQQRIKCLWISRTVQPKYYPLVFVTTLLS